MLLKTVCYNNSYVNGWTHENVFLGTHCYENFRLLTETFLKVDSHFATFFMDFTLSGSKVKLQNGKI